MQFYYEIEHNSTHIQYGYFMDIRRQGVLYKGQIMLVNEKRTTQSEIGRTLDVFSSRWRHNNIEFVP